MFSAREPPIRISRFFGLETQNWIRDIRRMVELEQFQNGSEVERWQRLEGKKPWAMRVVTLWGHLHSSHLLSNLYTVVFRLTHHLQGALQGSPVFLPTGFFHTRHVSSLSFLAFPLLPLLPYYMTMCYPAPAHAYWICNFESTPTNIVPTDLQTLPHGTSGFHLRKYVLLFGQRLSALPYQNLQACLLWVGFSYGQVQKSYREWNLGWLILVDHLTGSSLPEQTGLWAGL